MDCFRLRHYVFIILVTAGYSPGIIELCRRSGIICRCSESQKRQNGQHGDQKRKKPFHYEIFLSLNLLCKSSDCGSFPSASLRIHRTCHGEIFAQFNYFCPVFKDIVGSISLSISLSSRLTDNESIGNVENTITYKLNNINIRLVFSLSYISYAIRICVTSKFHA